MKKKKYYPQIFTPTSFSEEDYFDDCPICQTLRKAQKEGREPTMGELKEATLQAQKQGAIVGGSLLNEGLN